MVQRARTGEGQRIDVALMDCMLNLLVYELQEAQFSKPMARPTYGPVRAKDGDILIAPVSARNFSALRDLTGLPELSSDPRFTSVPARGANWTAMMQVIEKWTMQHTIDECLDLLGRSGVPSARFRDPAEALDDPDLADRGTFAPIADVAGEFKASMRRGGCRVRVPRSGRRFRQSEPTAMMFWRACSDCPRTKSQKQPPPAHSERLQ